MNTLLSKLKAPSLTVQIFLGLLFGVLVGALWPEFGMSIKPLATIFLHMIKMLIAPLIFATLVIGIAGHKADNKTLGRMGAKTMLYFWIGTSTALVIGLCVANVFQPGAGMNMGLGASNADELGAIAGNASSMAGKGFWETIVHIVPTSVIQAMAEGEILQLVFFTVFFALALKAAGEKGDPIMVVIESLGDVMFKFVNYVMAFAPMGIFGALAATVGKNGLEVLGTYAKLVGSLYFALIVFVLLFLGTVCMIIRVPFFRLMRAIKEPFILAFSTASSESALPKAMEVMEKFGVPKGIVSFVMPTGYSFNLDGSALYLSLAAMFVAQMANIEMSLQQQIQMLLILMITSKGVAAVPRASLVILAGTLTSFGLPLEGIAVILGIDHVLDMARTSVNLAGNCVATAVIARWEGVFDDTKMLTFDPDAMPLEELEPRLA